MRGPLPEEGLQPTWDSLGDMFRMRRFWELARPRSAAVMDDMTAWERHTWEVLEKFSEIDAYSLLSHKLLKFYKELYETAVKWTQHTGNIPPDCSICRRREMAGYDLIVSTCAPGKTCMLWLELTWWPSFFARNPGRSKASCSTLQVLIQLGIATNHELTKCQQATGFGREYDGIDGLFMRVRCDPDKVFAFLPHHRRCQLLAYTDTVCFAYSRLTAT